MPKPFRIDGVIGDDFRAADLHAYLDAAAGAPVEVIINSPGGSVFEGLSAYNALAEYSGVVTTTIDALAASAASLIFIAGDNRRMLEGAMLMLHRASGMTMGNANDHERTAETLAKVDRQVIGIYAKVSGLPVTRIEAMLDAETWLDAKAAVEAGFATAASVEAISAQIAAFLDQLTHFQNTPATVLAMAKETPAMPTPAITAVTPPAAGNVTADIFARCRSAGLTMDQTDNILAKYGDNLDKAKDAIIEMLAGDERDRRVTPSVQAGDDRHPVAAAAEAYLYARMTSTPIPADSPAKQFEGRSLLDVGARLIEANGGKIRSWYKDKLADQVMMLGGPNSTSDFPTLTASAGQRVLADAYEAAKTPLQAIARRRTAVDFRSLVVARLGEMPALLEVPEGGEIKYGSRTEAKESFSLTTWARIFSITRKALINDDMGAFGDSARAWGQAAANVEADQLVALITGGGVAMDDGQPLFSAAHGNLIHNTLDGVTALTAARYTMRGQTGLDGVTKLNIAPRYLVVGSDLETMGDTLVATLQPSSVSEVNAFAGKLQQVLVEPRLATGEWFLFGDPNAAEVISYAYLGDRNSPQLDVRDGWDVLGNEFRCVFDYGCGATGYRGAVYSDGSGVTS